MKENLLVELPKINDPKGNLSFLEGGRHVPFPIERVYWIYDVPGGEKRGEHAYKKTQEFIIAISGSFDVLLDDGKEKRKVQMNRSYYGVYVPALMWRSIENFSTNSLAMVLSDQPYDENDYLRNYEQFLKAAQGK